LSREEQAAQHTALPDEESDSMSNTNGTNGRTNVERRNLLGIQPAGSRRTFADDPTDHDMLRKENDEATKELASKVSRIKTISESISIQVQDSNRALDALDTEMSSVRGMLSGSMQRLSRLVEKSESRHMCYLVLFVVVVLLIVFFLTKSGASAVIDGSRQQNMMAPSAVTDSGGGVDT
jgi:blocked-early-in-transport protein 1